MADYTTSGPTSVLAHAVVIHPDSREGSPHSLTAGYLAAVITMWHAFVEAAANTNPGRFSIYGAYGADADDWIHLADFEVTTATPGTEAMTATEPAGEKVLACASTTGFTARNNIYVQDTNAGSPTGTTGALGSPETLSEWHRVDKIVSNTSVDIMVGLANQKDSSDVLWTDAEYFKFNVPPGYSRVRVDFSHEGAAGANVHVKAEIIEITDIE
jgi:hypothetical protein